MQKAETLRQREEAAFLEALLDILSFRPGWSTCRELGSSDSDELILLSFLKFVTFLIYPRLICFLQ